jgi:hypothetical protein
MRLRPPEAHSPVISVLVIAAGGIVLLLLMLRSAWRGHQDRLIHEHLRREAWRRVKEARKLRRRWW